MQCVQYVQIKGHDPHHKLVVVVAHNRDVHMFPIGTQRHSRVLETSSTSLHINGTWKYHGVAIVIYPVVV